LNEGTTKDEVPWLLMVSDPVVRGFADGAQEDPAIASVFDVKIGGHAIPFATVWMKYRYLDNVSEELRNSLYASFKKRGRLLNYGRVKAANDNRQEHICLGNKRFRMCFSQPYLICAPQTP
jgi:hypothetical protein